MFALFRKSSTQLVPGAGGALPSKALFLTVFGSLAWPAQVDVSGIRSKDFILTERFLV